MRRGQRPSAERVVLTLRQIEVQTAQGKSIAVACKEAGIREQSNHDECLRQEIFYSLEAQAVIGLRQTPPFLPAPIAGKYDFCRCVGGLSEIPCVGGELNIRLPWPG
ncbi:hypothetical protein MOX02_47210 [Methylobacterium oxalidis]|uniref:Transposase n=1 Tax=Methylobacterium oxalidis TaxID=944322 RepID=A0A512J9Q1_9HYPH|nr:hypothetical protein MOX02_47210 [Methylobacterium oxalidis]GJE32932.1 hypothetical protein LDDCCGHA_3129 [Methylobacterium oxalidis]GLS67307.1 hypothetical protein GCM10007888_56900 [Methylobacterium oxalidis]